MAIARVLSISTTGSTDKPFMLEFTALNFALDKFDNIIWGFRVELKADCQTLSDIIESDNFNTTHACWHDGIISHQIVDIHYIPGHINLVGDGISCKDEDLPHTETDSSAWSVASDWEYAQGLSYNLFSVEATTTTHSRLHEHFKNKWVFVEVINTLLGITGTSTDSDHKCAKHCAKGYFIKDKRLWQLGGTTPTCTL